MVLIRRTFLLSSLPLLPTSNRVTNILTFIFLSKPNGRDLASSGAVGRGTSTHHRPPPKPVSHALTNLRNEDFRSLRILTRGALERLD